MRKTSSRVRSVLRSRHLVQVVEHGAEAASARCNASAVDQNQALALRYACDCASTKDDGLAIASITLLECAWLFANRRVRSKGTVAQAVAQPVDSTRVEVLELTPEVAATAVQLPASIPKDPPIA